MERWDWAKLKPLQVGRYGEYLAKMEFTLIGLDVYGSEVDDKGIDFLLRAEPDRYWDVQVKTIRNMSYVFFQKSKFRIRPNLLAAVVHLVQGKPPACYLIPATAWLEPDGVLVDRDYQEGKSEPEYGINISKKNLPALERFRFGADRPRPEAGAVDGVLGMPDVIEKGRQRSAIQFCKPVVRPGPRWLSAVVLLSAIYGCWT